MSIASEHVFPHRKPIGRFVLETVSAIESRPAIPFRVSIYDGVMTGSLQTENGTIDIETFIEAEHEVLSVRVRPKDGAATSWRFEGETDPQPTRTRAMPPYDLGPFETAPPKIQTCNGRHLFSLRYDERGSPAGGITVGWDGRSMGDSIIYNATIAYDREQGIDTRKEAVRTLQQASKRGYEKRRRDHVAVWNEFMSRSFVSILTKNSNRSTTSSTTRSAVARASAAISSTCRRPGSIRKRPGRPPGTTSTSRSHTGC